MERWEDAKRELMEEEEPSLPTSEPSTPEPLPPPPPQPTAVDSAVFRHKGLLFSSYWQEAPSPVAYWGDVLIVRPPGEARVLRRVGRVDGAVDPPEWAFLPGREHRRLCIYGFVPRNSVEHIATMLRGGNIALVAKCDRVFLKPPRREELYAMWQREGHLVNLSPARIAVVQLDGSRPKFAPRFKGCPIYSHYVNQIMQLLGLPARLTC